MRLFLASFLSPEIAEAYESLIAEMASDVPGTIRSVPSGTLHLTIVFLGDVAEAGLSTCFRVLEHVKEFGSFDFTLSPPRIIYSHRSPRLVCVDVASGSQHVAMLQRSLHERLSETLQMSIDRPKPPHVTLARFSRHANRQVGCRAAESLSRRFDSTRIRSDRLTEVHLVKSTLTPEGPIYESIGESKCRA